MLMTMEVMGQERTLGLPLGVTQMEHVTCREQGRLYHALPSYLCLDLISFHGP